MKNAIKQIYLLFVIICFTLIIVDFGIISNSYINSHLSFFQKYTDLSNNFEHSHSDCLEDDFFIEQPFELNRTYKLVARFGADSGGADLNCNWVLDYSYSSLGVRLVRSIKT